jgi:hypothetical protein
VVPAAWAEAVPTPTRGAPEAHMDTIPLTCDGPHTTRDLTDEQVLAALAVVATPSGAAALLSTWNERVITAEACSSASRHRRDCSVWRLSVRRCKHVPP